MANVPELIQFDASVYQLETTDPVQGGVNGISNAQAKALANRTAYLKKHVDDMESGVFVPDAVARLESPTFSGSPKAPTPPAGDNSTAIATTAAVQRSVNGALTKNVAGSANVTLTAAEVDRGILIFTGSLTGNIAVIVPATAGTWVVSNRTTGSFSLTVKTAAGTGVAVMQNKNLELSCDGTNVIASTTDFSGVDLAGATATTSAQFDNDTSIATTAFVQRALGNFSATAILVADTTLVAADGGKLFNCAGTTARSLTLPAKSTLPDGWTVTISTVIGGFPVSISTQNSEQIDCINAAGASSNIAISYGEAVTLTYSAAAGKFFASGANLANLRASPMFGVSKAASGYQKLPSGLIVQWGAFNGSAAGDTPVTFPIAFPTGFLAGFVSGLNVGAGAWGGYNNPTLTGMSANWWSSATTRQSGNGTYLVIGH